MADVNETRLSAGGAVFVALKIAAILAFVLWTNEGFIQRVDLLVGQNRFVTLFGFAGMWGLSILALLVAAFQPHWLLRYGWATVFAITTSVAYGYHRLSGSEFGVFDALSLWNARHEASRALDFYSRDLVWLALVFIAGVVVFVMPPLPRAPFARRWLTRLAFAPAIPVIAICAIILAKEGGGSVVLPSQFAPLSVGIVVGSKLVNHPIPQREAVSYTWRGPFAIPAPRTGTAPPGMALADGVGIKRIVVLVDESVRGDYIDFTPGNPHTPAIASHSADIVNFGPAASGGNCSHYSNAILRFGAARSDIGRKLLTIPSIWQYAKKAGFRTVFIDGQAGFNRNPGKLQNFMTNEEARSIDTFHALDETIAASALNDNLFDIVQREIKSDKPVLIYANKNGAHFPYDIGYPADARQFRPSMSEGGDTTETRINSFRNVVGWSVDRIFRRLFDEGALKDTVIIYTSDHGQNFNPVRLTHCSIDNPDPREALVPLFVITDKADLKARLARAADESRGYASHFQIVPTVLELLGYSAGDIGRHYDESLLRMITRKPAFTTGDIFGLFAEKPRWNDIDLKEPYLENVPTMSGAQPSRSAQQVDPKASSLR